FSRDWSSDVCSSDLQLLRRVHRVQGRKLRGIPHHRYAPEQQEWEEEDGREADDERREKTAEPGEEKLRHGNAGAAEFIGEQAARDAADAARSDDIEGPKRDVALREKPTLTRTCTDERHEGPEGVKLPHMPEISERGGPEAARAEDDLQRRRIEHRSLADIGAVRNRDIHDDPAKRRDGRNHKDDIAPEEMMTDRFQKMGERRAKHQRADEIAERPSQPLAVPAGRDLHADWINPGEEKADQKAEKEQRDEPVAEEINPDIARGA